LSGISINGAVKIWACEANDDKPSPEAAIVVEIGALKNQYSATGI
jgi:hypothetical protein